MQQTPFPALIPKATLAAENPVRFHEARHDFSDLLAGECYDRLKRDGYYVLHITGPLGQQSYGICGLINTSDYAGGSGRIRPHEATLMAREAKQRDDFLRSTHFIKPVLLTCPAYVELRQVLEQICASGEPELNFYSRERNDIRLFVIDRADLIDKCGRLLNELPSPIAVADGHHRISTARQLANAPATANRFARIPAVLIPADSLVIDSYICSISDPALSADRVMEGLAGHFNIQVSDWVERPEIPGHWLLANGNKVYQLSIREPDGRPGTAWFDDRVLPSVFGITDSSADQRWSATPADRGLEVLLTLKREQTKSWHFLPPPVDMSVFFRYLQQGKILPPKSTRFLPRIPSGLIVHELIS